MLNVLAIPDPAPNVDWSVVVPGGQLWNVLGVSALLSTAPEANLYGTTAHDSSGNARHGQYLGSGGASGPAPPFYDGAGEPGLIPGNAAVLVSGAVPGSADTGGSVVSPATALDVSGSFSIEVWVSMAAAMFPVFFSSQSVPNVGGVITFEDEPGANGITLRRRKTAIAEDVCASGVHLPHDNAGHQVVATYDSVTTQMKVFLDGAQIGFTNFSGGAVALVNGTAFSGAAGTDVDAMVFDELSTYTTGLTAARVAAHYAARGTFAGYRTEVIADAPRVYYHLDETPPPSNSEVVLTIADGVNVLFAAPAVGVAISAAPQQYEWVTALNATLDTVAANTSLSTLPNLTLPAGYTLGPRTVGDQLSFQWSAITVWYDYESDDGLRVGADYFGIVFT